MIAGRTFAEAYKKVIQKVIDEGSIVKPRGQATKELLQETIKIEMPASNMAYIKNRKWNLLHAIVESLYIFSSVNDVRVTSIFNKNMKNFSDNGITMYGDYGSRIADKIPVLINKLKDDKDTRQAVLTIYDSDDIDTVSKDIPCTVMLQFTVRNSRLNMHVFMRSNDCIWGMPYDVFMFTNMQMVIANELGIVCGSYYHTATSMHIYHERDKEIIDNMLKEEFVPIYKYNRNKYNEWYHIARCLCKLALSGPDMNWFMRNEGKWVDDSYIEALFAEWYYRHGMANNLPAYSYLLDKIDNNENAKWLEPFTRRWRKGE